LKNLHTVESKNFFLWSSPLEFSSVSSGEIIIIIIIIIIIAVMVVAVVQDYIVT
jgi:hypothetical protein